MGPRPKTIERQNWNKGWKLELHTIIISLVVQDVEILFLAPGKDRDPWHE